ncbi:MAG: DNA polymerase, partial [Nitrososphaera sp.]|nr:DNA polymerase [Nitrososphaera sp.]
MKESFTSPWLAKQSHPFFKHLLALRQLSKVGNAFLGSFLELQHKGRLHCVYHQTRGDRGGTRSGRLSASAPNLQQIPARNEDLAPKVRGLFLPEVGQRLVALDYSQQEPRVTVHYAKV